MFTKKENDLEIKKMIDFLNYKNENELIYCTFYQQNAGSNDKERVVWTTTKKYNNNFSSINDVEKISEQLISLTDKKNTIGSVSKITCSENCYIVEFSFYPSY